MYKKTLSVVAALTLGLSVATSGIAAEVKSPLFGAADVSVLSVEKSDKVVGKGYWADYYGYYGNLYSYYAQLYSSYGQTYDDYSSESTYYYNAYYYSYYAYVNNYYAYLNAGT